MRILAREMISASHRALMRVNFAATVLFENNGVRLLGRVQFVHGAESGVRSVIEPFEILFRRHESRGAAAAADAAAFPRNYCLPVNSRTFRQPMPGVSKLES